MPHIILEHNFSDEEKINKTCKELFNTLAKQESVKSESIKTRSIFVNNVYLADTKTLKISNFAHLNLKLLPGRADELKNTMSRALYSTLLESLGDGTFSVEINELHNYSK